MSRCSDVHRLFNGMKRFRFPFSSGEIPENGIYVLFERGEVGHSGDRIVRVGTHTGVGQLRSRLFQHFLLENKDRSIFRKNIGRAILNRDKDEFLKIWNLDLTTRKARENFDIDFGKQKKIEEKVSQFIRENFSFVVLRVDDKAQRLELESKLISTISLCNECGASNSWLGNFSPVEKIRVGGLWQVNELWKEQLSEEDLANLAIVFSDHWTSNN